MELIDRQAALDALDKVVDIKGYAYIEMEALLKAIPAEAVTKDCKDCFGASFGDCDNCNKIVPSVRSKIANKLADAIDSIDAFTDTLPERIKNDLGIKDKYKAKRYKPKVIDNVLKHLRGDNYE